MNSLKEIVGEVEADLVDLLAHKELGSYAINLGFNKIKKRINEIAAELHVVINILVGES